MDVTTWGTEVPDPKDGFEGFFNEPEEPPKKKQRLQQGLAVVFVATGEVLK